MSKIKINRDSINIPSINHSKSNSLNIVGSQSVIGKIYLKG